MKLLFDENLSPRLVARLDELFPESVHVRDLGLQSQDDRQIWAYAAAHGYTIVSKDDDFHHLSFLLGAPPKVIGIQLGNSSTTDIEHLLRTNHAGLLRFASEPSTAFIALPPLG